MSNDWLGKLNESGLISAVLEFRAGNNLGKEYFDKLRMDINNKSDYKVKNWYAVNNENLYIIEVVKK